MDRSHSILVVDDIPINLSVIAEILAPHYSVKVAKNGARALEIVNASTPPDLILLDVEMPGIDGFEICRELKSRIETREIPVIFLTAKFSADDEAQGFFAGAADYICKPVNPPLLLARVAAHLASKSLRDMLKDRADCLEEEIRRRTHELGVIQDVTIQMMSSLAETRDNETGNHIARTQWYVKVLAEQLSGHVLHGRQLTAKYIDLLFKSAPLHDLGKIGIPDAILRKPSKLTQEEFVTMKTHPILARDAIEHAESRLGSTIPFLTIAKEIAYGHHEKWDGSGYPQGLSGEAIPISARLMAVADVYDALISKRVYKPAMCHEEASSLIKAGRGTHFDPAVVDAFVIQEAAFRKIAIQFSD